MDTPTGSDAVPTAMPLHNAQLQLLMDFSRQLSISLDLPTICTTLQQFIAAQMDCNSLVVSRYTPEDNLIQALYAINDGEEMDVNAFPPLVMPENPGQGSQSLAIRERRSLYIPDFDVILQSNNQAYLADEAHGVVAAEEFLEDADPEDDDDLYTRSALIVPLILQNQSVGALQVMSYRVDAYQPEHLQLLEAVAAHVAIAINNAMLFQQAQVELGERRRADHRFRMLFDAAPDVLLVISTAGEILHVNHAFEKLLGYSTHLHNSPDSFLELLKPEQRTGMLTSLQGVDLAIGTQPGVSVRTAADVYLECDLTLTPIMWGDQAAALVILHDTSAQRLLAEAHLQSERLRMQVQKEREVLEVRERFIALLSHEFRTPLTVIVTSTETLLHYEDRLTHDKRSEKLHQIRQQANRMVTMINDVLDISRIQAGKLGFAPQWLNLEAISTNLIAEMRETHAGSASLHTFDLCYTGDAWTYADEKLMLHILTNLLSNAVKYSPDGGTVALEIMVLPDKPLQIVIRDQGMGIPVELLPRLFEPFFRTPDARHIPGTGLGLAIVAECVQAHGGSISVMSVEHQGTTFTILLPDTPHQPTNPDFGLL